MVADARLFMSKAVLPTQHADNIIKVRIYYLYKDERMYVCVCVCPAACRRTYISYHHEIWRGLLILPGLGTKLGATPNVDPRPTFAP